MSNYITGLFYNLFTAYDQNTNQYVSVPYYNAYQGSDGQIYNIEDILKISIPNVYGLTKVNYPFVDVATNTIQNHQIPTITTLADGKPLYYSVPSAQHSYDANTNNLLNQSLQNLMLNPNYFDNYLHDIITGTVFNLAPVVPPTPVVVEPTPEPAPAVEEVKEEPVAESTPEPVGEVKVDPAQVPAVEEKLEPVRETKEIGLDLSDVVGEDIATEITKSQEKENLNPTETKVEVEEEIIEPVIPQPTSNSKFNKIEFVDRDLNDVTEQDVIQNIQDITEGKTLFFKPRVKMSKDLLVNITATKLRDIYNDVREGFPLYDVDPEVVKEIRYFFGKEENFELKTIFDAFSLDEITAMLHINIVDQSPTGLYEGIYKHLYIYKQYLELRCNDEYENYTWLLIKLVHFSTQTQKAVVIEIDDKNDEDDEVDKEKAVIFKNDLYYESNNLLRRYLTDELLFTDIRDSEGNLIDGFDKLRYICSSKATGKIISMKSTPFNRGIGIDNIAILISSNNLTLLSGQNELCPNVLGLLYGDFQKLVKNYVSENTLTDYKLEDLPVEDICERLSYNNVLEYVKGHDSFKKAYGITSFMPISEVCNMCLDIEKVIFPIINGTKSNRPIALICKDLNSTNQQRRVILPTIGKCLINLDELGVSFNNCQVVISKAEKDGIVFGAIRNFKDGILASGAKASLIPVKFDESTTIASVQIDIDRCIEEICSFPRFVQVDEQNVLHGYRILGLYK